VPGDHAQDVHGDTGVGHPGQACVSQAVSAEVFVAEFFDDVVPVGRVAENCGGDAAAARSCEEAGVWPTVEYLDTALDQVVEFDDERDVAGASAFGSFVGEACGCRELGHVMRPAGIRG
jgi:hypothetical protein